MARSCGQVADLTVIFFLTENALEQDLVILYCHLIVLLKFVKGFCVNQRYIMIYWANFGISECLIGWFLVETEM